MMKKGEYIRALLKSNDIKSTEISKKMGIKPNTLSNKLTGRTRFNINEINILCDELGLTYEEVFRKEGTI